MTKPIVTVTPNPALDMTWVADAVHAGGTHRVDAARVRAGGKGINVARVVHAQALPTIAITTCGGSVGEAFAAELATSHVPNALVPVSAETRRSIAIYDETVADTMIFNERGVAPSPQEWGQLVDAVAAALDEADAGVLVISGSLPPGVGEAELRALIALGAGRGCPVIVDTSGPLLLVAAQAGAALLKPNREELRLATGESDPMRGMAALLELGAGTVMCSLGAEGMLLATSSDPLERSGARARRARLTTPLAGNPTGAGDAAVAAAASLAACGAALGDTAVLRRATIWSAAAVLMPLAGEIARDRAALERSLVLDVVTSSTELSRPAPEGAPA
ncbi:1-phosphofructokinase family hexose kinase [Leucobacter sp. HY1908]